MKKIKLFLKTNFPKFYKFLKKYYLLLNIKHNTPIQQKESIIAHTFLDGLNGIEIGGSNQNSFGLEKTGGYANIDFDINQGGKWQNEYFQPKQVNIVAFGDDLPFKDNSLDYVISSHVIEHFFDPIKTIKEWLRVVKKDGIVFMIVPHKKRTFDRLRPSTSIDELIKRNKQILKPEHYIIRDQQNDTINVDENFVLPADFLKINSDIIIPNGYKVLTKDNHSHLAVYDYNNMIELCKYCNFNIVYSSETDDKVGNGFTIVLKK